MEFSSNPNKKYTEMPQSSISTHPFLMFPLKISNPQARTNKLANSVFYRPCPSRLVSIRDTYFHIFSKSFGFYLSIMLVEFLFDLYLPTFVRRSFQFTVFTFLENALNLCIFTHVPVPTQNSR